MTAGVLAVRDQELANRIYFVQVRAAATGLKPIMFGYKTSPGTAPPCATAALVAALRAVEKGPQAAV